MKEVKRIIFEKNDVIRIKKGITKLSCEHGEYCAGMIGVVTDTNMDELTVQFTDKDILYSVESRECDYVTPEQAKKLSTPVFLSVNSLDEALIINNKKSKLVVGCQEISFSDAIKIADFIKLNLKLSAGRPKKVAKKKK